MELDRVLDRPEDQELAKAFVALINEAVLGKLSPADGERVRIRGLKEVPTLLAQRMERIARGWEMQGWEKGRKEGRQVGRKEGRKEEAARLFQHLFKAKFGDVPAWGRERTASASQMKLETWAKRLLMAEKPEDVFDD